PLHAEVATGLAVHLDEAHFEHDLLRRHHRHRIDGVRIELFGERHRLVDGHRIADIARQHEAAVYGRDLDVVMREAALHHAGNHRGVLRDLHVEYAYQLLAFGISSDAGGTALSPQDRQRAV